MEKKGGVKKEMEGLEDEEKKELGIKGYEIKEKGKGLEEEGRD
jgi:hypothetical protein